MLKYFLTFLLIFSCLMQAKDLKQHFAQKVDPNQKSDISNISNIKGPLQLPKEINRTVLGRTWYDYTDNNGRTIAHALDSNDGQDGIHFVFMKRQPDPTGNRLLNYDYFDLNLNLFYGNLPIDPFNLSGSGKIANGKFDEVLGVMSILNESVLFQDASEASYTFTLTKINNGFNTSIDRQDSVIVIASNFTFPEPDSLFYSLDYGNNWNSNILPNSNSHTGSNIQINPQNTNELCFLERDPPYLKKWTTTNLGTTWTFEIIYDQSTVNPDGTVYLITNFEQYNYIYSSLDGVFHVVANGYGLNADSSDYIFPIIYWNSRDRQWIELTDPSKGRPTDSTITQILANNRPGNGIGNAYPHISVNPNTGEMIVIWQEWEEDGAGMPVVVTPSGGSPIYCTDIWGVYTNDDGRFWHNPFFVAGTQSQSDVFPNIAKGFVHNQSVDSVYFDIMYLWDTNAGVSLFAGGNDASECVWYYEQCSLGFWTNLESNNQKFVDQFILHQNYPNPFNPATKIKYELPNNTDVNIQIFDILGQKVKTLVNKNQNRGIHFVTWDGLNKRGESVSGGIYYYKLQTSEFQQTKKMLLLK